MCQDLGFRYAPDLRFFRFKSKEHTESLSEELKGILPDVIKEEIREKAKENNTPAIVKKKTLKKMIDSTHDRVFRAMLYQTDYSNSIFEEKNKSKLDEYGRKIRNNKDLEGKKKKYKKKNKAEAFWNSK